MTFVSLKTVYGPHPSKCYGSILYIDSLLPPKKCPYDCVFCTLGKTAVKTTKPLLYVSVDRITRDLEEYLSENNKVFDNIMIWGSGDPLLNYQLPVIVSNVRNSLEEKSVKAKILVKTTGLNLVMEWVFPLYEIIDEVIIQLSLPGSLWRTYMKPPSDLVFRKLLENLSLLDKRYKGKISVELILFKIDSINNFEEDVLIELISAYKKIGVRKIYVSTIDRPTTMNVKPVSDKILHRVSDKLVDEGFKVDICTRSPMIRGVKGDVVKWMYNHILRIPLSTDEITMIYGDRGLSVLDQLVKNELVEKISWGKQIFFKLKQQALIIR